MMSTDHTMGASTPRPSAGGILRLADRRRRVVPHAQLLETRMGARSIEHRVASGRLQSADAWGLRGRAAGRREAGWWMAAVLACGPRALLGHHSAAALWGIRRDRLGRRSAEGDVHVVVAL